MPSNPDHIRFYLALGSIGLLCLMIILPMFVTVPDAMLQIVNIIVGGTLTFIGSVFNFYFGSSDGSKIKTEAMVAEMQDDVAPTSNRIG